MKSPPCAGFLLPCWQVLAPHRDQCGRIRFCRCQRGRVAVIEMTFEFLDLSAFGGGWRHIVDTQNRQSTVPEPTTYAFMLAGLAVAAGMARPRRALQV